MFSSGGSIFQDPYALDLSQTSQIPPAEKFKLRKGEARPVDEFANFLTHGIGFLLSCIGAAYLVMRSISHEDWVVSLACVAYSASLVGLYLASTLSHAFYDYRWRRYYRTIDQAAIFLLITGSFTPFGAVFLRNGYWPLLTVAMWAIAIAGASLVMYWGYLSAFAQKLYILIGWLPAISMPVIFADAPLSTVLWIVGGGLCYTLGTYFLWYDRSMKYMHAMWHLSVIAGSVMHFIAIVSIVR